jgi:SAM-dependent methyltransferase
VTAYSTHDASAERRRLRLQSEVLEEVSDRALARLGSLEGAHAIDVACGAMGMLRALSRRVGAGGGVVGADVSEAMLEHAREFAAESGLANVSVVKDDLFASSLEPRSFDVVHARFVLAPLGRDAEVAAACERLARPDGWIVLEEPDSASWTVIPKSAAHEELVAVVRRAYDRHMGGFDAGRRLLQLARARGWRDVGFDAHVVALPPGHPYLHVAAMMATSLRAAILRDTSEADLDRCVRDAEAAYAADGAHGVTFTLMQVWGRPAR